MALGDRKFFSQRLTGGVSDGRRGERSVARWGDLPLLTLANASGDS